MSDELTGLPEGWELVSIKDVTLPYTTTQPTKEPEKKFLYIDIGSIDNTCQTITDPKTFLGKDAPSRARRVVRRDDVLFSTVRTYLKNIARVPADLDGVLTSTGIAILRAAPCLSSDFLFHWVTSDKFIEKISSTMDGTLYPAVTDSDVASAKILIPPLNEQKRIVAKIEELRDRHQAAKQALEAVPKLCDRFRQSVLAAAFRGDLTADWREENPDVEPASVLLERIRSDRRDLWEKAELERMQAQGKLPKNDQWKEKYKETTGRGSRQLVAEIKAQKYRLEDLPDKWTAVRLGEILQVQTGYAFKSQWFTPEGIRLLRGTNIVPGSTRWEDVVYLSEQQAAEFEEYRLCEEDIVIAMDRPVISTGLKIARLKLSDLPALLLQRVGRFRLEEGIDADYLFGFLNSQLFLDHIQDQATGTQLPHISANDIESTIIPLPPSNEQQQIAEMISKWMLKVGEFTRLVDSASLNFESMQQAILAKAFRGELVEQDPNDEPASVLLDRIRAEREQAGGKAKKGRGARGKGSN